MTAISQEPEKKTKKKSEAPESHNVTDTITVSIAEKTADTLYLKQSLALDELDSLIIEKKKK